MAASALGPRLGAQSSPAARRAAFARAASPDAEVPPSGRAGREQAPARSKGRERFSPAAGPLLHHSARRGGSGDSKDDSTGVGFLDLVHEAAAAANVAVAAGRDPRRSLHIGRGTRTAPGSPPRRLQPRCSLRWLSTRRVPHPIGEGRGGSARAGSGGRGRGAGPAEPRWRPSLLSRLLRGHQAQAPPLTARPSSRRFTHGHRLRQARRLLPPTAPARPRLRRAPTPPGPAAAQRTQQAPL